MNKNGDRNKAFFYGWIPLLLGLAGALPMQASAQEVVPGPPQLWRVYPLDDPGTFNLIFALPGANDLPAAARVTGYQFRRKLVADRNFPTTWQDVPLSHVWGASSCGGNGDTSAGCHLVFRNVGPGSRYMYEFRAVNVNGAGSVTTFPASLAADRDAPVQFEDSLLMDRIRSILEQQGDKSGSGPITQLEMSRLNEVIIPQAFDSTTGVQSLKGLEYATNLRILTIDYHMVTDLSPLEGLFNLEHFNYFGILTSDISALADMPLLRGLGLNFHWQSPHREAASLPPTAGRITDSSALRGKPKLEWLWLADHKVNLEDVQDLVQLKYLSINSNELEDLSPLRSLSKLEELHLSSNSVEDLSPLATMTEMSRLQLESNRVSDLSPLGTMTKMQDLWLANNPLGANAVSVLRALVTEGGLRVVDVRNTPVSAEGVEMLRGLVMDAPHPGTEANVNPVVLWDRPPAAPQGLTAQVSDGTATLSWQDLGDSRVVDYAYRYRARPNGEWTGWTCTAAPTCIEAAFVLDGFTAGERQPDMADRTTLTAMVGDGASYEFELRAAVSSNREQWLADESAGAVLSYTGADGTFVRNQAASHHLQVIYTYGASAMAEYEAPPTVLDGRAAEVAVDGSTTLNLADAFRPSAGDGPLLFAAESSDATLATATIDESGVLTVTAAEDAADAVAVITVTATDSRGQRTVLEVEVTISSMQAGFWRGWRVGVFDN